MVGYSGQCGDLAAGIAALVAAVAVASIALVAAGISLVASGIFPPPSHPTRHSLHAYVIE